MECLSRMFVPTYSRFSLCCQTYGLDLVLVVPLLFELRRAFFYTLFHRGD